MHFWWPLKQQSEGERRQRLLTALCLQYSSGRNGLFARLCRHDSYEGVAENLSGIDSRSLRCAFEGPEACVSERKSFLIGPR